MFSLQWTMWNYQCFTAYKQHLQHIQLSWGISRARMQQIRGLNSGDQIPFPLFTKLSHYYLYSTLHQFIKAIPLSWKFHHVKGHENGGNTYNNIDEWGRMNIKTDRLAKDCRWNQIHSGAIYHPHKFISGAIQPTTME